MKEDVEDPGFMAALAVMVEVTKALRLIIEDNETHQHHITVVITGPDGSMFRSTLDRDELLLAIAEVHAGLIDESVNVFGPEDIEGPTH